MHHFSLLDLARVVTAAVIGYSSTTKRRPTPLEALGRLRWRSLNDSKGSETALRAALALREKIARDNPDGPEVAAAWLSDESELPGMIGNAAAGIPEGRWVEILRLGRDLHARFPDNLRVTQCMPEILVGYGSASYLEFGEPLKSLAVAAECQRVISW